MDCLHPVIRPRIFGVHHIVASSPMKEKGGEKRSKKRESKEITMKESRTVVLGSPDAAQDSWELECLT